MSHKYIAQNGRLYRMSALVHFDQSDIEAAIEYLTFHGRPPTQQAVADLLRSAANEGVISLVDSLDDLIPDRK